jgi:SAM-dependent methyltransferase
MEIKLIAKNLLRYTPFYPRHIGGYVRNLYFWKCIKKLPMKNFTYVLDAGCGGGEYARKIAMKYPYLKINAYDIEKYKFWNDRSRNVNFKQRDLLKLEEENYYDFCLNIDVLEHIPENHKVLENIYKALKAGGYFYLHMPSKDERRIFPKRFFREFDNWAKKEHIGEMYKLEELKDMITSIGFEIIEARETFGFLGSFAWEIDRITDKHVFLKVILMPLLKFFAHLDVKFSRKGGGILILAMKNK